MNDAVIELKDLSFSYPGHEPVLKNINLTIYRGEKVAIIGPNGAGKSTFVSLLNGIRFGSGEVKIVDQIITQENLPDIRKEIGIVFQNPDDQLFCPMVFDDVAFGPLNYGLGKDEIIHRVAESLKNVGLENYENKLINELSYGEKKLVSIATILSMDPTIIAFDEPSSNLDPYHRRMMINWIASQKEKTILITTHDLDMVLETSSRVIILNDRQIQADDVPEEILTNKKLLESNRLELPLSRNS